MIGHVGRVCQRDLSQLRIGLERAESRGATRFVQECEHASFGLVGIDHGADRAPRHGFGHADLQRQHGDNRGAVRAIAHDFQPIHTRLGQRESGVEGPALTRFFVDASIWLRQKQLT